MALKTRRALSRWLKAGLALLALCVALLVVVDVNLGPIAMSVAETRVRSAAVAALNESAAEVLGGISYGELITIHYNTDGNVSSMQANAAKLNSLATETALASQARISEISQQRVEIPIGTALGSQLLSGKGPRLSVSVLPVGSVTSKLYSEFTSAGINQTRHRLYIILTANMQTILAAKTASLEATAQISIAETIITGRIPETYLVTTEMDDMLNLVP